MVDYTQFRMAGRVRTRNGMVEFNWILCPLTRKVECAGPGLPAPTITDLEFLPGDAAEVDLTTISGHLDSLASEQLALKKMLTELGTQIKAAKALLPEPKKTGGGRKTAKK
jgi:hypothetical protein